MAGTLPSTILVGALRIDPCARSVTIDGMPIRCTGAEFSLLERLARDAGHVVPRDELMLAACDREASALDRALDVHISRLRRKLEPTIEQIVTVRGVGYMLAVHSDD